MVNIFLGDGILYKNAWCYQKQQYFFHEVLVYKGMRKVKIRANIP